MKVSACNNYGWLVTEDTDWPFFQETLKDKFESLNLYSLGNINSVWEVWKNVIEETASDIVGHFKSVKNYRSFGIRSWIS